MARIGCYQYNDLNPPQAVRIAQLGAEFACYCGRNIKGGLKSAASKTANFVTRNKYNLLSYAIAWGVILCSIGMMHGFKSTTAPFSIGMGAGLGFGLLWGFVTAGVFNTKNSIGGRIQSRMQKHLDLTTRTIALTLVIAIYLIAASRLPPIAGVIAGALGGDHLAHVAYWGKEMVKAAKSLDERVTTLEEELAHARNLQQNHDSRRRTRSF